MKLFYVLEGNADAYVEREVLHVGAGEFYFFPRRRPHTFVIRSPRLRAHILITPGRFRAMSSPARNLDLPTDAINYSQGTPEQAVRMAAELGVRFLSPDEIAEQMPAFARISVS